MARGKRYNEIREKVEPGKRYELQEAVSLVKECATAKFDESVELHVRLGVDSRHADQQVRGAVILPHGTGREIKVLAIVPEHMEEEVKAAGADYVGDQEYLDRIQNQNWLGFDVMITSPDMMSKVGRLGRILGPQGLMPNPRSGTVTTDVAEAVRERKAGKIEYRLDRGNIIHCPIGKVSFTEEQLQENYQTLMDAIVRDRPAAARGQYIRSCTLASTMGPGVRVQMS